MWDYEVNTVQECGKSEPFLKVETGAEPNVRVIKAEVIQVGGFIFGIGSHNELQMVLCNNFNDWRVLRKDEDCEWLRKMLIQKHPGCFVPPLEPSRELSSHDERGIRARTNHIENFLNTLLKYPEYQCSRFLKRFLEIADPAKFNEFKDRE